MFEKEFLILNRSPYTEILGFLEGTLKGWSEKVSQVCYIKDGVRETRSNLGDHYSPFPVLAKHSYGTVQPL